MTKFKEKFAKFRKTKTFKIATSVFISAMIASMFCLSCFAAESDTTALAQVQSTLSTSFSEISSNLTSTVLSFVPVAVSCTGLFVVIRKSISYFVSLAKKG